VGGLFFATLSTSGSKHTCGLTASGTAYCWGWNSAGNLGDGTTTDRSVPTLVFGGLSFKAIAAGGLFTCAVTVAGVPYCWGGNAFGQLGNGTTTSSSVPTPVSGGLVF